MGLAVAAGGAAMSSPKKNGTGKDEEMVEEKMVEEKMVEEKMVEEEN